MRQYVLYKITSIRRIRYILYDDLDSRLLYDTIKDESNKNYFCHFLNNIGFLMKDRG
jgi:hypothetical protein